MAGAAAAGRKEEQHQALLLTVSEWVNPINGVAAVAAECAPGGGAVGVRSEGPTDFVQAMELFTADYWAGHEQRVTQDAAAAGASQQAMEQTAAALRRRCLTMIATVCGAESAVVAVAPCVTLELDTERHTASLGLALRAALRSVSRRRRSNPGASRTTRHRVPRGRLDASKGH